MDDKQTLETEFDVLGRALSLEIGVHWDAKNFFKFEVGIIIFVISIKRLT